MPRFARLLRALALPVALLMGAGPTRAAPRAAAPVVTVLGDSVTAGFGLAAAQAFPVQLQAALARLGVAAVVRGAGVSGDTTQGALARLDFSVQPDTRVCVIELGANDALQSIPAKRTAANLTEIVARLRRRGVKVVLLGQRAPQRSSGAYGREFDGLFPRVAKAAGATLAPDAFAGVEGDAALKQADGFHPNAAGAHLLATRVAPVVAHALR